MTTPRTFTDPTTGLTVNNPLVLHHGDCPDGFTAALCAWRHFEGQGEYLPVTHGNEPPDVTGRDVYILDIAFSLETMRRLESQANRMVLLDHHQSAMTALHGYSCTCGLVKFDLGKSAARMAWEHFNPDQPPPPLVVHVEDRDLVRWLHADSPAYLLSLDSGPYNFYRWNGILNMPTDKFYEFMARGEALLKMHKKLVYHFVEQAQPVRLNGEPGYITNAPFMFHTDVGLALSRKSGTFGAAWCLEPHEGLQRVRIGMRADSDYNTLPISEVFGGGGHPNSSAFRLPLERLPELLGGNLEVRSA